MQSLSTPETLHTVWGVLDDGAVTKNVGYNLFRSADPSCAGEAACGRGVEVTPASALHVAHGVGRASVRGAG